MYISATAGPQESVIYFSGSPTVTKHAADQHQQLATLIEPNLQYVFGLIPQKAQDTCLLNQRKGRWEGK